MGNILYLRSYLNLGKKNNIVIILYHIVLYQ